MSRTPFFVARARPAFLVTVATIVVLSQACGHGRLLPAEEAQVVSDAPDFAVGERSGMRMAAKGDDWTGRPADLSERLTPVRVRIVNHTGRSVQILYGRFKLAGAHGRVYRPLPPVPLPHDQPKATLSTVRPYFSPASFFVRPAYRSIYPSLVPWPTRLATDDEFYRRQYALWEDDLPTREMKRMGLPEGVLADGGQLSGFLFFEDVTRRESKLTLKAVFRDERGADTVAAISIPFRVE